MELKMSFIVPVYNVGYDKLERCLNSVTKAMKLIKGSELVLVNDCSPLWSEESKAIPTSIDESRIMVVHHTENKGLGAARNTGLEYSAGKYVWFIDSDDSIVSHKILDIFKYLNEFPGVDVFQFKATQVGSNDEKKPMYFNHNSETNILQGIDILNENELVPPCVWSKIYKRDFLNSNDLRNPEGVYYEDQEFLVRTALANALMLVTPVTTYMYYFNSESIMNSNWDYKHILDAYMVVNSCIGLINDANIKVSDSRLKEYKYTLDKADASMSNLPLWQKIKLIVKLIFKERNL